MSLVNAIKDVPAPLRVIAGALEILAIIVGLAGTVLCLMSLASAFVDNLWGQLVPALLIGVGSPLLVVERVSHDHRGRLRLWLAVEILALLWLGFTLVYVVIAFQVTRGSLVREASMLYGAGASRAAAVVSWLARDGAEASDAESPPGSALSSPTGEVGERAHDASVQHEDAGVEADSRVEDEAARQESPFVRTGERPWATLGEVRRHVAPSLVTISVMRGDRSTRVGTGFVVGPETIATASWVLDDAAAVAVRLSDGTWVGEVTRYASDDRAGIALLSVAGHGGLVPVELADADDLERGAQLAIIGSSLGLAPTVETGNLEELVERSGHTRLAVSAIVGVANVGGPVVTRRGEVVGVAIPFSGNPEWPEAPQRTTALVVRGGVSHVATSNDLVILLRGEPHELSLVGEGAVRPLRW